MRIVYWSKDLFIFARVIFWMITQTKNNSKMISHRRIIIANIQKLNKSNHTVLYSYSKNNMWRAIPERCAKSIFLGGLRINSIFDSFLTIDKEWVLENRNHKIFNLNPIPTPLKVKIWIPIPSQSHSHSQSHDFKFSIKKKEIRTCFYYFYRIFLHML